MNIKHTPGPWKWKSDEDMGGFHIYMATALKKRSWYESHHHIEMDFTVYPEDGEQWEEAKANARLMAAAPDLLAALRQLMASGVDQYTRHELLSDPSHYAVAAIFKATGEFP